MVFGKNDFRDYIRSNAALMERLFEDFARALEGLNNSVVKATNTKWRNLFSDLRFLEERFKRFGYAVALKYFSANDAHLIPACLL